METPSPWERDRFKFETANAARQFEIELFWKRANYFWLFVAAALAAYGLVWRLGPSELWPIRTLIATLGMVGSYAWFLVNRGSKWWFERWENKVKELEAKVSDVSLYRLDHFDADRKNTFGAKRFSVSQIAIDLSLVIAFAWVGLLFLELVWVPGSLGHRLFVGLAFAFGALACLLIQWRAGHHGSVRE